MPEAEALQIKDIHVSDRIRKEFGDISGLAASIKEFGLIQPIVLVKDTQGEVSLVAGGRRFRALEHLGFTVLQHELHYRWRDEISDGSESSRLRLQSIELEENLKRKDLTWQEQVVAKQRLLDLMQKIHGTATLGGRTRTELQDSSSQGFGVRKLSEMLGESVGATSQDLQVASAINKIPILAKAPNKTTAFLTLVKMGKAILQGATPQELIKQQTAPALQYKIIVDCKDEENQRFLLEEFGKMSLTCRALIS